MMVDMSQVTSQPFKPCTHSRSMYASSRHACAALYIIHSSFSVRVIPDCMVTCTRTAGQPSKSESACKPALCGFPSRCDAGLSSNVLGIFLPRYLWQVRPPLSQDNPGEPCHYFTVRGVASLGLVFCFGLRRSLLILWRFSDCCKTIIATVSKQILNRRTKHENIYTLHETLLLRTVRVRVHHVAHLYNMWAF